MIYRCRHQYWTFTNSGIYYISTDSLFKFIDLRTKEDKTIVSVQMDGNLSGPKLSPDGEWIYFDYRSWQNNILMMENWR